MALDTRSGVLTSPSRSTFSPKRPIILEKFVFNELNINDNLVIDTLKKSKSLNYSSLPNHLEKKIKKSINKDAKKISLRNLWVVRQFKNEYNPIHYHEGQLSGVGYLKIPKDMNQNKLVKNKKFKTNGTIDFINGQTNFLSKSIYNLNPKLGDLLIFPNYLMHTAYPFNVKGERRSFSFNVKILFKK